MITKNPGITILISMGTSMMVLALAFYTLNSIVHSQEQATNIQRTTQLFFASESGAEAAFFHHNARGAGINFTGTNEISHPDINANAKWQITGRTTEKTAAPQDHPIFGGLLKENQTIQIPFSWDNSASPSDSKNLTGTLGGTNISISFFKDLSQLPLSTEFGTVQQKLVEKYGNFSVPSGFNFGGTSADEVLIDWSVSRKMSGAVETFVPTINDNCSSSVTPIYGFICEQQMLNDIAPKISTSGSPVNIQGKILPGGTPATLTSFWGGGTEHRLTFRPLLKFTDADDETQKIRGIPFVVSLESNTPDSFPKHFYTVTSDVDQETFSQRINIEVPERTSIGAFDYVIFD